MEKETLKAHRQKLGLTHKGLGEKLGIPRSTITHWENDRRISVPKLLDLALKQLSNEMGITLENKIA